MNMVREDVVQQHDRRLCQRIDDEIVMFWREVKADEIPEASGCDDPSADLLSKVKPSHSNSTCRINLSSSGMAFLTEQDFPLGTLLELKMVFTSALTSIIAYGRVIYCIHYSDDKPLSHRIGVGFIRLQDYDREKLDGHVNSRKCQATGLKDAH